MINSALFGQGGACSKFNVGSSALNWGSSAAALVLAGLLIASAPAHAGSPGFPDAGGADPFGFTGPSLAGISAGGASPSIAFAESGDDYTLDFGVVGPGASVTLSLSADSAALPGGFGGEFALGSYDPAANIGDGFDLSGFSSVSLGGPLTVTFDPSASGQFTTEVIFYPDSPSGDLAPILLTIEAQTPFNFTPVAAPVLPGLPMSPSSFSPGGVPEPSTWAMLAIGFAALGGFSIRARKTAVAV